MIQWSTPDDPVDFNRGSRADSQSTPNENHNRPMNASELPSDLFDVHRAVDAGLQLWGIRAASEASSADLKWCRDSFPDWKQSIILPFVCPTKKKIFKEDHGNGRRYAEDFDNGYGGAIGVGVVDDFANLQLDNYCVETKPIKAEGFVAFAFSTCGDHFVIDIRSGASLEVKWIYFDDVATDEVSREKTQSPGWTLRNLYQALFRQPRWDRLEF